MISGFKGMLPSYKDWIEPEHTLTMSGQFASLIWTGQGTADSITQCERTPCLPTYHSHEEVARTTKLCYKRERPLSYSEHTANLFLYWLPVVLWNYEKFHVTLSSAGSSSCCNADKPPVPWGVAAVEVQARQELQYPTRGVGPSSAVAH